MWDELANNTAICWFHQIHAGNITDQSSDPWWCHSLTSLSRAQHKSHAWMLQCNTISLLHTCMQQWNQKCFKICNGTKLHGQKKKVYILFETMWLHILVMHLGVKAVLPCQCYNFSFYSKAMCPWLYVSDLNRPNKINAEEKRRSQRGGVTQPHLPITSSPWTNGSLKVFYQPELLLQAF